MPGTRIFYCDPPGHQTTEHLRDLKPGGHEVNYIYFHDQEPIHLSLHQPLFDDIVARNRDLNRRIGPRHRAIVHSERNSTSVSQICKDLGWKDYYYFYHGWAALDWFRGYHRSWLIPPPAQREIRHSFIGANRIIGGMRQHRVKLMYWLLRGGVQDAYISFPARCPVEDQSIMELLRGLPDDAADVFQSAGLPWDFAGESGHPMHSYELTQITESTSSLAYVITETVFDGQRQHLTEKTFKPVALQMPFVMVSCAGSLGYLRNYGFQTFGDVWNESYDDIQDDDLRLQRVADLLLSFDAMTPVQRQDLYRQCLPIVQHNFQHFYGGGFEDILWQELQLMLKQMRWDFDD